MAIVTPFVQVGTYPTRNFATLGPLQLRPPFTGASIKSFANKLTNPINEPSGTGQASHPILPLSCLQSAVFLVNSRSHRFNATFFCSASKWLHIKKAYLLPKLRYHFAQFLQLSSLMRLRILIPPTCVRLGYGFFLSEAQRFFLEVWYRSLRSSRRKNFVVTSRNRASRIYQRNIPTCLNQYNR